MRRNATPGTFPFQSTLPAWGSDTTRRGFGLRLVFQSTLPAWGSDRVARKSGSQREAVSIHAPRVGERRSRTTNFSVPTGFNPRSPRGGATRGDGEDDRGRGRFQSTLPAWGSDAFPAMLDFTGFGFNPRSPRGGATQPARSYRRAATVSIHAPRVGERLIAVLGDVNRPLVSIHAPRVGERHHRRIRLDRALAVSIHAPRVGERRPGPGVPSPQWRGFNPRSPRGGATAARATMCR